MAPTILPNVRAFRPDGSLGWQHVLRPYAQTTPTSLPNSTRVAMNWDPRSNTAHHLVSMWPATASTIALQLVEWDEDGLARGRTDLRFLDLRTGAEIHRQLDAPLITGRFGNTLIGYQIEPYPRIRRFTGRVGR